MQNYKELMFELIRIREEMEVGVIPFVEPGSLKEDLVFDEYFHIKEQINSIIKHLKNEEELKKLDIIKNI